MRILHLVHQYPPDFAGGTEYYTQSVAHALSERGHSVAIFTRAHIDGQGSSLRMDGDVSVHLAWNGVLTPRQRFLTTFGYADVAGAFDNLLAHFDPHLIHIQHLMGMPTALLDHIQRRQIPFVLTLHDFWWICANAQLITNYSREICDGPKLWLNCARCVLAREQKQTLWFAIPPVAALLGHRSVHLRRFMTAATRVIAPSRFVKEWHVQHGLAPEKVVVLKHGVDPASQTNTLPTAARPTTNRPLRLLYAGGLSWQKGVHIPIEALASVAGNVELWIAGDESFDPEYSQQLHQLAGQDSTGRVRFLGRLSHAEVQKHLADVDAALVPALWYETFSLFVHEAFAAGTPVIASNLGALAEAVRDGVDGLLLPPGDVDAWKRFLQRICAEPGVLADLRSHIRPPMRVAEHIDRLLTIYSQAIGETDPLSARSEAAFSL